MEKRLKTWLLLFSVLVFLSFLPVSAHATVTVPEGNPVGENIAWWSATGGNGLYSGNSSYELSFDPSQETDADKYRGIGDYAFGLAAPGAGEGFESPDGVSAAYLMTQLRRTDKLNADGKPQAVKGGHLCFTVADGFYTEYENEFSFYIEYWSKDLNEATIRYPQKTAPGAYTQASISLSLEMEEDWNVLRVDVNDAWLQTLNESGTHDYNQIFLTGTTRSWFNPRKAPIYVRRFAVVPKAVVDTLKNPDNVFDPVNTKVAPSNSAVLDGEPQISYSDTMATVTVNLKDIDYESGSLNLVAYALRPAGDYIAASSTDSSPVTSSTQTLTLTATVAVPAGCELKYMIMDDKGKVIDNVAPGAMGDISLKSTSKNVTVSWEAPEDDFGCSYVVYKNGVELAVTDDTFYKDDTAVGGEVYTVKAVDHAGEETAQSEGKTAASLVVPYHVMTATPVNSNGLSVNISDNPENSAYCEVTAVEGVDCVTTVTSDSGTSTYLHVTADEDALSSEERAVTVLVDYYDDGSADSIILEYSAFARKAMIRKSIPWVSGTEGAGWKQAVFHISNAYFTRELDDINKCDFRIGRLSGAPLAVSQVQTVLTSLYE